MSFVEEESEDSIKWEEVEDVKEVSESTMKAFYQEFQVKKNENELLLNRQKELLTKLSEEIAEKKSLRREVEITQQNYFSTCTNSDEINKIANAKVKTKVKANKEAIKETREQISERNLLTKEIELVKQRLEVKKKALKEEESKIETELKRQRLRYQTLMEQAEVLKSQIAIFSNEYDESDDYYEEEDNDDEIENSPLKETTQKAEKEDKKQQKACDILPVPRPLPKPEEPPFQKCKDPELDRYKLSFNYLPSGIPESQNGKKLVFPSGEDIVICKGGNKIIHARGFTLIVYSSGDVLQKFPDGTTAYKYKETNAVEIDMADTTKVTLFANSQVEIRFPNGDFKVQFPDGTIKYIKKNGESQTILSDGTVE